MVSIYNVSGKLILQSNALANTPRFDLSDQAEGLYFVTISAEGKSTTQKLLLRR